MACLFFGGSLSAQSKKEWQEQYQKNIKKEYINDVYIPKDTPEAIEELKALSTEEALLKFSQAPEDVVADRLRFGLGRWIEVNWNLHDGSRYSHYLRELGITYVDDMVEFTILSLHRHLNQKELAIQERASSYYEQRKLEYLENR